MNQLFQFEQLKQILELLCKEHKGMKDRIKELEDRDIQKMKDFDDKLNAFNDKWEERLKDAGTGGKKSKNNDKTDKDMNNSKLIGDDEHDSQEGDEEGDDSKNETLDEDLSKSPHELIGILFKKVKDCDKEIKALKKKNKLLSTESKALHKSDSCISSNLVDYKEGTDGQISMLNSKLAELLEKNAKIDETLENISVKMADFSIYELFKDPGDGNIDMAKALVMTLEAKVFKKFGFVDERGKDSASEIIKLKNDLMNMKNSLDLTNRAINRQKEDMNEHKNSNEDNFDLLSKQIEKLAKTVQTNYTELLEVSTRNKTQLETTMKENYNSLLEMINSIMNDKGKEKEKEIPIQEPESPQAASGLSEEGRKRFKDIYRRLIDLENAFKAKLTSLDPDTLNKKLNNIQEDLKTKLSQDDLSEINQSIAINKDGINDINNMTSSVFSDHRKMMNEHTSVIRRIEYLSGALANLHTNSGGSDGKGPIIDISKFIDQTKFAEMTKAFNKEIDKLQRENGEIRRMIEDISYRLKNASSNEGLKELKDLVFLQLEEFKTLIGKKYVDKKEFNKTIKLVYVEIKSLENTGKRVDGESWLLAKRPLNGYQCASCESNLSKLPNQSKDYLPWNKYPARDEKTFRMGNGFSHMLQMFNPEAVKSCEQKDYISDTDSDNRGRARSVRGAISFKKLPNVRLKLPINIMVDDIVNDSEEMQTFDNPRHRNVQPSPKIVKIFKKRKNVKTELNINTRKDSQ